MHKDRRTSKNRSQAAEQADRTRKKEYRRIRSNFLILDCNAKKEKRSEGKLVFELLRIVDYGQEVNIEGPLWIGKKSDFFAELERTEAYSIHISSHGGHDKEGSYLKFPYGGKVYAKNLEGLWEDRSERKTPILIALSACYAGHEDLIKAFSDAGCRYCIAPRKGPFWHNAALFWMKFYTVLYLREGGKKRRSGPWIAFRNAKKALPKESKKWSFFDRGVEFTVE